MTSPSPKTAAAAPQPQRLHKPNAALPLLIANGPRSLLVPRGTAFGEIVVADDTPVDMPTHLEGGLDYGVLLGVKSAKAELLEGPYHSTFVGGFHFAPGGNAFARAGGDSEPTINPRSLWDHNFRPRAADPRGMALIDGPRGPFWCDIYLTGADHLDNGTSSFGVTIADGSDRPQKPGGDRYSRFDYETAVAVLAHHGKQLLAFDEFFAAAFGVTEKTACGDDPRLTGLDAPRTSKHGLMQATGNMLVWGHDGDPDGPRASIFGGSWVDGGYAGSRCAGLDGWPDYSGDGLGARGRCDHLQLDLPSRQRRPPMTGVHNKSNDHRSDALAIVEKYEAFVRYLYPILQSSPRKHGVLRDIVLAALFAPIGELYHAARSRQVSRLHAVDAQFAAALVEDLGIDGLARIAIGCQIETAFDLAFDAVDQDTEANWSTVADVIATAERLLRAPFAATSSGRAA